MKVGVLGPIWLNIPPSAYGGTEDVVYNLVQGLTKKGHDVTLFGPATAKVDCKVFPTVSTPLREQNVGWDDIAFHIQHISTFFEHAHEFDILHVHLNKVQDFMSFPLALQSKTPVLFTIHFQLSTPTDRPVRHAVMQKYRHFPFTSISNSQRTRHPELNYIKTVYNALNIEDYTFSNTSEDYFVWLGKINPRKGTDEAIRAAKKAGVKLFVLGVIDKADPRMFTYYEEKVKPLFDYDLIHWLGPANLDRKVEYLSHAKAFLNPIQWEEPYGLVMAESQAVGTPVISYNRGAAPELIQDGKTGFLVDSFDEMVAKMKEVDQLDRKACRENVEQKFTIEKNIEGYEEAYQITIENWEKYLEKFKSEKSKSKSIG